jgi:hypothetical protein
MAVKLSSMGRSHYLFLQVALQSSSLGIVEPVAEQLLLRKSGSAGNRVRNLWIFSQEFDHWTTKAAMNLTQHFLNINYEILKLLWGINMEIHRE